MKQITDKILLESTKVAKNFFDKHPAVYNKFIENIKNFYHFKYTNIDIKAMKTYKKLYRMRINDYRIIYKVSNNEIVIISVIAVGNRGHIYKKF